MGETLQPETAVSYTHLDVYKRQGTILVECGKMLKRGKYKIKVLNTINFAKSMHYNPFAYLRSEKDILKLVNTIIVNTKGEGSNPVRTFGSKQKNSIIQR